MAAPFKTRKGVLSSAGAGDAGKVPLLNASGKIDPSMLEDATIKAAKSGSATAISDGGHIATHTVTFEMPFDSDPYIIIMPMISQAGPSGFLATWAFPDVSTAGFTVKFDINESSSSIRLDDVPFRWLALTE